MAVSVQVRALQPRLLYLLTITGQAGELELLRWTLSTGEVASPAPVSLPAEVVSLLQLRLRQLTSYFAAGDLPDNPGLLSMLCVVRDGRGEVVATAAAAESALTASLVVPDMDGGTTYYLFVSIPHTLEASVC